MTNEQFAAAICSALLARGVTHAPTEIRAFVDDNPHLLGKMTPEQAMLVWIEGAADAVEDPP